MSGVNFGNGKSLDHAAILSVAEGKSELAKRRHPRQSLRAAVAAFVGRFELHANTVKAAEIQYPCGVAALWPRRVMATGDRIRAHGCRPIITLGTPFNWFSPPPSKADYVNH
jgi:hypothetical protein